jgi:hypothetical protein
VRKIFGPKREEVAGGWRRLHNEELHNSYALSNIGAIKSRGDEIGGACNRMSENRNAYNILVAKPEGK